MSRLLKAISWASEMHKDQVRKFNGKDYFEDHCMRLLVRVSHDPNYGQDEDAGIIIVCHDVVEDCTEDDMDFQRDVFYGYISELFGDEVRDGIYALTNEFTKARYPNFDRGYRKARELERLKRISLRSKILKLYDRIINLEDILGEDDAAYYGRESLELADALACEWTKYLTWKVRKLSIQLIGETL